jgi:transposase
LVEARLSAMRLGRSAQQGTYYQAQFFRIKARRGPKKAAIAVAASLLTAAYHMLKNGTFHQDLGADFLVKRDRGRIATKLANRLKDLGYDVAFTQRPEFAATLTSVSG